MHLRFVMLFTIIFLIAPPASSRTWYIEPDGSGDAPTIQAGLDLAQAGDTVLVAAGTYEEQLDMTSGVVLISEDGPDVTIVQGRDAYMRSLVTVEDCGPETVIAGFTLTGQFNRLGWGGGMRIDDSYVHVTGNIIEDNEVLMDLATGGDGAGIYIMGGAPLVSDNIIRSNRTRTTFDGFALGGGGLFIYSSSAIVHDNVIEGNFVSFPDSPYAGQYGGGGIYCTDDYWSLRERAELHLFDAKERTDRREVGPIITGNLIRNNVASFGGGIVVTHEGAIVRDNDVSDNRAIFGGGVAIGICDSLVRNTIDGNLAIEEGAAICLGPGFQRPIDALIRSNTLFGNIALNPDGTGAIAGSDVTGTVVLEHNIIVGTVAGYGVSCPDGVTFKAACNDIWGNDLGDFAPNCTDWIGLNHNSSLDPHFCDPEGGDFRLQEGSPCGDAPGCGQIGRFGVGCRLSGLTMGATRVPIGR